MTSPSTSDSQQQSTQKDPIAGSIYGPLIQEQLTEERQTKTSLEQRGITVITTSAALVSLLFGLGAVVTSSKTFVLPGLARAFLVAALICFLIAALQGIRTNWILDYKEIGVPALRRLASDELWQRPATLADLRAAQARIGILEAARNANHQKAQILQTAMIAEVAAVFFVAASVVVILVKA